MSEPYAPPTAPPPGGTPTYGKPGLPWDREKTGNALVDTSKALVTGPGAAYEVMQEKGDYLSPILYAVIFGTLGGILGQIWNLLFGAAYLQFLPPEMQEGFGAMATGGIGGTIVGIVLAPVIAVVVLFVSSAIYHLFLLLVGGTKDSTAGFEGTLRAVGYGQVCNLAAIVPIAGSFIAAIWGLVLYVIGLSRVHHTSTGKALLAVLLPIALCCVCIAIIAATAGAGLMAAIAGANQ